MNNEAGDLFSDLEELVGEPALLKSEDVKRYRALQKKVEGLLKPQDLFAALDARDIVNAIWEGVRFEAYGVELLNAERRKALGKLTDPESGYAPDNNAATKAIETYRAGLQNGLSQSILRQKLGIRRSAVNAHAVVSAADGFLILDKLAANRKAARKTALKDFERRKRLAAKHERLEAKLAHTDVTNDNRPAGLGVKRKDAWGD